MSVTLNLLSPHIINLPIHLDRPFALVHTGETRTLVPVSRDHLATRNERARNVRDRSRPVGMFFSQQVS